MDLLAQGGYANVYINKEEQWIEKIQGKIWSTSNTWIQYTTLTDLIIHQSCREIKGCPKLSKYTVDASNVSMRMPYYGVTLNEYFSKLSLEDRISRIPSVMIQIIDTCQTMMNNGIIHTDIKPSNILINSQNDVHVIDFNMIALKLQDNPSDWGEGLGTWNYASPEIVAYYKPTDVSLSWSIGLMIATLCFRFPYVTKFNKPANKFIGSRGFWKKLHRRMFELNNVSWKIPGDFQDVIPAPILDILRDCWIWDPKKRISLSLLRQRLEIISTDLLVTLPLPLKPELEVISFQCDPSCFPEKRKLIISKIYDFCQRFQFTHLFSNQVMMLDRCSDILFEYDDIDHVATACIIITLFLQGEYVFNRSDLCEWLMNTFDISSVKEVQSEWVWFVGKHLEFRCWQKQLLVSDEKLIKLKYLLENRKEPYGYSDLLYLI